MPEAIAESVKFIQEASPNFNTNIEMLQFLAANAFTIVGGMFSISFMILIFIIFVKAIRKLDLKDLFVGEVKKEMSLTKFWTNVAYFAATLAFLAANLISPEFGGEMTMIWLIYLGTVGTNAVASKWMVLRYEEKMRQMQLNSRSASDGILAGEQLDARPKL